MFFFPFPVKQTGRQTKKKTISEMNYLTLGEKDYSLQSDI